jgi:hypothetical protein
VNARFGIIHYVGTEEKSHANANESVLWDIRLETQDVH